MESFGALLSPKVGHELYKVEKAPAGLNDVDWHANGLHRANGKRKERQTEEPGSQMWQDLSCQNV